MNVVWLKRDLRVDDHAPLAEACARGEVLVVYVFEDEWLTRPETDAAHVDFVAKSLREVREALRARGGMLHVLRGRLPDAFEALYRRRPFTALWSHEETGNAVTYARDLRVKDWAAARGVRWTELPQTGVVRRLRSRDGWAARWTARMSTPPLPPPDRVPAAVVPGLSASGEIPTAADLGLPPSCARDVQPAGERAAQATLESFFAGRGIDYATAMSSPNSAWDGCSRLSAYLAFGNLSIRRVYRTLLDRRLALEGVVGAAAGRWRRSLAAFEARLRWRCHFMQKLEDEPALEHHNLVRSLDGLREHEHDDARYAAWCEGRTGYPMIDACMRALTATGWINFRMRAMLVSFAAYDLWLHWRPTGLHLARRFLDFEPGIHWSQMQMQSGTTGINTLRIYSPTRQLLDHDPQGVFVRRWVPELGLVPLARLAEPWRMTAAEQRAARCILGVDYPWPVVEHAAAVAAARARLVAARRTEQARAEAARVLAKHGSRLRPRKVR
jgi:deoxyribodipyrimidine photo-lyase